MPSPVISDINPQSLGGLQPIRPPQAPISIPNPLSVTPYFQGVQLANQQRQMDQEDALMAYRNKQLDFQESSLVFQQTQELLNMNRGLFDEFYATEAGAKKQAASGLVGGLGLDPRYEKHRQILDSVNTEIQQFQSQQEKIFQGLQGKKDPSALNQAMMEMNSGVNRVKSKLASNPEYMVYAKQERNYQAFLDRIATLQAKGYDIDMNKVNQIKNAYQQFANGQASGKMSFDQFNEAGFYDNITFQKNSGEKRLQELIDHTYAPFDESAITDGPGGTKIATKYRVQRTAQQGLPMLIEAAMADNNIVKMYEAISGQSVSTDQGKAGFAKWIEASSKFRAPLPGKEKILTEYGNVVYDPVEYLKATGKRTTSTGGSGGEGMWDLTDGKTEGDRSINRGAAKIASEGYNPRTPGVTLYDYEKMTRLDGNPKTKKSLHREIDPETKRMEVWEVEVDSDTGERILNDDGSVKKIEKIATFDLLTSSSTTAPPTDDIGSKNNNPGNIRATPEQIRRGTVKVDDNGFVVFPTIEEGEAASLADNESKITGNSSAMRTSTYMKNKYGEDNLQNYQEFSTIEDLINVRTPKTEYGGDNTAESVENFLDHLTKRGFPRDLKTSELTEDEKKTLNKAIIEFESPDSFSRLYGGGTKKTSTEETPDTGEVEDSSRIEAKLPYERIIFESNPSQSDWEEAMKDLNISLENPTGTATTDIGVGAVLLEKEPGNTPLWVNEAAIKKRENQILEKNRQRALKGEPILKKEEDDTWKTLNKTITQQKEWRKKQLEKLKPKIKAGLIAKHYDDLAEEAYDLTTYHLLTDIEMRSEPVDLYEFSQGTIPSVQGRITESPSAEGDYIYEYAGKKEMITGGREGLREWIKKNAKELAFSVYDIDSQIQGLRRATPITKKEEPFLPTQKETTKPLPSWIKP